MVQSKGWKNWQGGCLAFGMSLILGWGVPTQAQENENKCYKRNYAFNILAENDLWGSGSDKHFTHGTRLSFVESRRSPEKVRTAKLMMIFISWMWCGPFRTIHRRGGWDSRQIRSASSWVRIFSRLRIFPTPI